MHLFQPNPLFVVPLILIGIMLFVFWLIILIDAIKRKFRDNTEKIIWILVIILTGILGSLIYYFVVLWKDKTKSLKWFWWTILILFIIFLVLLILSIPIIY